MLTLPRLREFAFLLAHLHGPRGIRVHLRLGDAFDLVAAAVRARDPLHAELARQLALDRGGGDGLQRAEDRAHAHGVQGAPFAVAVGPGDPGDLVVDVVLGVAVPAGALQPGRDDQPGGLEPAGLAAVDPGAVVAGAGDPGPGLQVLQRSPVGPVQRPPGTPAPARPSTRRPAGRPARRARRSFSRSEACRTEMDLENETVTS